MGLGQGALAQGLLVNASFWRGKRVLLTGHTGFKGAWASVMLADQGASVFGLSLAPEGQENLWREIGAKLPVAESLTDIRDAAAVEAACAKARPQIVLHMAAQAQVRQSFGDPLETFGTNVMGTANVLNALRGCEGVEAVLVITSDKVYRNKEDAQPFTEDAHLGGSDPYSASKAACELVVRSFAESYFDPRGVPVATARGGNVVGGGDFASERLVPDLFRAARAGTQVELRYPNSRRPWQHVLDCLSGYFAYVEHFHGKRAAEPNCLNIGPEIGGDWPVAAVADAFNARFGTAKPWRQAPGSHPPEKKLLMLNSDAARARLSWKPRLTCEAAIAWTADWYRDFAGGADALSLVRKQIEAYRGL